LDQQIKIHGWATSGHRLQSNRLQAIPVTSFFSIFLFLFLFLVL
jgi:hypothetical protein